MFAPCGDGHTHKFLMSTIFTAFHDFRCLSSVRNKSSQNFHGDRHHISKSRPRRDERIKRILVFIEDI